MKLTHKKNITNAVSGLVTAFILVTLTSACSVSKNGEATYQVLEETPTAQKAATDAVPSFEHQLTHRIFIVRPYFCRMKSALAVIKLRKHSDRYLKLKWVLPDESSNLGISAVTKRVFALIKPTDISS
jgi:hypothetical protein